jgi:hypothetical protein
MRLVGTFHLYVDKPPAADVSTTGAPNDCSEKVAEGFTVAK